MKKFLSLAAVGAIVLSLTAVTFAEDSSTSSATVGASVNVSTHAKVPCDMLAGIKKVRCLHNMKMGAGASMSAGAMVDTHDKAMKNANPKKQNQKGMTRKTENLMQQMMRKTRRATRADFEMQVQERMNGRSKFGTVKSSVSSSGKSSVASSSVSSSPSSISSTSSSVSSH